MPTTLDDRYELDELIGAGAAGRVYRARDLRLGRIVAVKRLRSDALGGDDARARFEREALALARVSDPHVLPVFDVSADDDAYLVTAFCADGTLADRLATRVLTCSEVRELVHDVAAGLVAMHAAGVVHRDIKPRNILRLDGRWVIGDLGIARLEGDSSLTQTGAVIGTPDYWAPETARGAAPTPAVDVYGLGCAAFEALAGHPPFRGASPLETGLLHATAPTPAMPPGVRDRDPALAGLLTRMLAKSAGDRPLADELTHELPAHREPADTLVYPDPAPVALTQPALASTVAYPSPPARRRRRLAGLVLLTCGAVAGRGRAHPCRPDIGTTPGRDRPRPALPRTTPGTTQAKQISTTAAPTRPSVPRVVGKSVASATAVLAESRLKTRDCGSGDVGRTAGVDHGADSGGSSPRRLRERRYASRSAPARHGRRPPRPATHRRATRSPRKRRRSMATAGVSTTAEEVAPARTTALPDARAWDPWNARSAAAAVRSYAECQGSIVRYSQRVEDLPARVVSGSQPEADDVGLVDEEVDTGLISLGVECEAIRASSVLSMVDASGDDLEAELFRGVVRTGNDLIVHTRGRAAPRGRFRNG